MADESAQRRRSNPFVTFLAVVGAFVLTTVLLFLVAIGWGLFQFSKSFQFNSGADLPGLNRDYVAWVKLNGPIGAELTDDVLQKLDRAQESKNARGIFLEVNSPGGAVVASQEIFDKILAIREQKPVLSYFRDVAASGSYYASSSSTWIVANRNSMVGSIGVIMTQLGMTRLLESAKLDPTIIKTGSLKDSGTPLRPMTEDDQSYLTSLLEKTHQIFMSDVLRGRDPSTRERDRQATTPQKNADPSSSTSVEGENNTSQAAQAAVPQLLGPTQESMDRMRDGRVVLGEEALELGLVDALASKDEALNILRAALGDPDLELIEFRDPETLEDVFERYLDRIQVWADRIASESQLQNPRILAR